MTKRKITDLYNLKFEPFDNYGSVVPGMSWCKISYNRKNIARIKTFIRQYEIGMKQ